LRNDLYLLTGKYIGTPLRANLLSSRQRLIISIIDKQLTPDWSITRVGIQARQVHHHKNSKQALQKNVFSVHQKSLEYEYYSIHFETWGAFQQFMSFDHKYLVK
jgi:hypothetical protein